MNTVLDAITRHSMHENRATHLLPHMKCIAIVLIAIALSACAGPDSLDAAKLAKARESATLDVSPISLYEGQIVLAAGEYKAELEDSSGVFYRGPGKSFRFLKETYPGGIYITKPPGPAKYRLYYYKTSTAVVDSTATALGISQAASPAAGPLTAGVGAGVGAGIVTYMVHMNDGKLMLLQPVEGVDYLQLVRARN